VLVEDGSICFTTLVKGNRVADRYLKMWEKNAAFYFEKLKAKIFAIYKRNML